MPEIGIEKRNFKVFFAKSKINQKSNEKRVEASEI